MPHYLPSRLPLYFKRLHQEYVSGGREQLASILAAGRMLVDVAVDYDNLDGGTDFHDIRLFLPRAMFGDVISLSSQDQAAQELLRDLHRLAPDGRGEAFRQVFFEMADERDPEYQQAVSPLGRPEVSPDSLQVWRRDSIRLFISLRDSGREAAEALAAEMDGYGISSFVAHRAVRPMVEWRPEIESALATMEVLLALVTDDFHESPWVNQEIGYALARGVPIIPLRLGSTRPAGFIEGIQGLSADAAEPEKAVPDIYRLLVDKLGSADRQQAALITAFLQSSSFTEAIERFDRLSAVVQTLSEADVDRILQGFASNSQLHAAGYFGAQRRRLEKFLERATGRAFRREGRAIIPVDDELPAF